MFGIPSCDNGKIAKSSVKSNTFLRVSLQIGAFTFYEPETLSISCVKDQQLLEKLLPACPYTLKKPLVKCTLI